MSTKKALTYKNLIFIVLNCVIDKKNEWEKKSGIKTLC